MQHDQQISQIGWLYYINPPIYLNCEICICDHIKNNTLPPEALE